MGKIKEIYIEIQDQLGEDVEITNEMFTEYVNSHYLVNPTQDSKQNSE